MDNYDSETQLFFKILKWSVIGIVALIILFGTFYTVDAGELGVKTRNGKVIGMSEPGLHMKLPIFDKIHRLNVRTQVVKNEHFVNEKGEVVSDNALSAASKDLQDVKISTVVNYRIDRSKVIDVYNQYKTAESFEEGVVKPLIKDSVKTLTATYTAEELVTKRSELNLAISEMVSKKFENTMALYEQGNVTNIEFSPSFTQAIERKVTAEQDALAAKNKLEQTKYEAEQRIVQAKGDAEAIRIQSQAINSQGGEDYVQLQAIEKWDGRLPAQMIPGSTVPFINLTR